MNHRSRTRHHARRLLASLAVVIVVCASVRVDAASVSFSWNAPTTNEDGTPLVDLAGYRIYLGTSPPPCPSASYFSVGSPTAAPSLGQVLSSSVASLVAGAMYFVAVTAVDLGGLESRCTQPVSGLAEADITVSPVTAVDFGSVPVGTAADRSFTVQNATGADLTGSANVGAPFSIVSGSSFSLAPGASQTVVVRLLASTAGSFASNVNVAASGDTVSRTVTGAATATTPPPTTATLTVTRTGSGSVSSTPAGIQCGGTCAESVTPGTSVALTAVAASGSSFSGWSGGGCSGTGTCTVSVNTNTTVNATFAASAPPSAPPVPGEIIVDNAPSGVQDTAGGRTFTGTWCAAGVSNEFGSSSLRSCGKRGDTYRWTPTIPMDGTYDVYVWIPTWGKGSTGVPVTVSYAGGAALRKLNERRAAGGWVLHGRYPFAAGTAGYVQTDDSNGAALADAVRFVPVGP
jgi:hypothetical protein